MRRLTGTNTPLSTIRRSRWLFSGTAELRSEVAGSRIRTWHLMPTERMGPAARSFAADAHDRIMVRIKRSYRIQVRSTKMHPNGELPSDSQQTDRHQPDTEVREKPVSQFIIAPRAQASSAAKHKRR